MIPDILRAFESNKTLEIRNPHAIRPWQHVLEPLSGYLLLAEKLYKFGPKFAEGWNFGPDEDDAKPVEWIVRKMVDMWGDEPQWRVDDGCHPHEANYLKLDCAKAKIKLDWHPAWSLEQALQKIVDWHKAWLNRENMKQIILSEIIEYMNTERTV